MLSAKNQNKYRIIEELYASARTRVHRAIRQADQVSVIIKAPRDAYSDEREAMRFQSEIELTKAAAGRGVIQVLAVEYFDHGPALVLEDIGGSALHAVPRPAALRDFLRLALDIAVIMSGVHQRGIIHRDISPGNLILNRDTGLIRLIDFGIALRNGAEQQAGKEMKGTPAYIAPEQTGRMNRDLDYRADYYSFGAMLFELLTGQPPFGAEDAAGLIYAHIANTPTPPRELDRSIPEALSAVILKLLAKNPEERYQSSRGIIGDLRDCLEQWERTGAIESFAPGRRDASERFEIPRILVNRDEQLNDLMQAYTAAAEGGRTWVLVSGDSGVGKSELVYGARKRIIHRGGFFIHGKFDQFKHDSPYSALITALQGLTAELLRESPEKLARWRSRLEQAIQPNGRVITDLIPDFEGILGPGALLHPLGPAEDRNRFFMTLRNFIQAFADAEHPLVLFLDDLQWADEPTLRLLEFLADSRDLNYFMLIGVHRPEENAPSPLLEEIFAKIEGGGRIILESLNAKGVASLVSETLMRTPDVVTPVSDLIYARTGGNPFFVGEMLRGIYREGFFQFSASEGLWTWDLDGINDMPVTDNIVDLMIRRLEILPEETRRALQSAACMGSSFDAANPVFRGEFGEADVFAAALREGIIVPTGKRFRFRHDRVQQAVNSMLDEGERRTLHLKIARVLSGYASAGSPDRAATEIIGHYNEALSLLRDEEERLHVCRLNVSAAAKARASTAVTAAFQYSRFALGLLPDDCWESDYALAYTVHMHCAEAAYLTGQPEAAEGFVGSLLEKARTSLEKAAVYRIQVLQHTLAGRPEESIQAGCRALSILGVKLSPRQGRLALLKEVFKARWNLGRRAIPDLLHREQLTDPVRKLTMRIMAEMNLPAYLLGNENLFAVLVLKQVNIALRFGNCPEAAYAYVCYAVLLNAMGDLARSREFGELAAQLNDKLGDIEYRCRVHHVYACFVHTWNHPWHTTEPYFRKAMDAGPPSGDLLYAGFSANSSLIWQLELGLQEAYQIAEGFGDMVRAYQDTVDQGRIFQQYRLNLMGRTLNRFTLSDDEFDEGECVERLRARNNFNVIGMLNLLKLRLYFLYRDYDRALALIPESDETARTFVGAPFSMEYCFFAFMVHGGAYRDLTGKKKRRARRRMEKEYARMRKWFDYYPGNSFHFIYMMRAQFAIIAGDTAGAVHNYREAVRFATENGLRQYRAMAGELLGELYLELNEDRFAGLYFSDAYRDYQALGALGKLADLRERYGLSPNDLEGLPDLGAWGRPEQQLVSHAVGGDELDLDTVIQAAQALSSEVVLEKLLTRLMRILRENAGAARALLLLPGKADDELLIQARTDNEKDIQVLTGEIPDSQVPMGIVNYTARSLKPVVLDDACEEGDFTREPYILKHRPKSILCLPVLNQGKLIGVLYLENRIASRVFNSRRLKVARILAAQGAVSLENARLFESVHSLNTNLEERIQDELAENRRKDMVLIQQSRLASMGEMIQNIAHQWRQPLTVLNLILANIKDAADYDELDKPLLMRELGRGGELVQSMSETIDDFRHFFAPNRSPEVFRLADSFNRALGIVHEEYERLSIKIQVFADSRATSRGFPNEYGQVLLNVLNNARDAIEETGPTERGLITVEIIEERGEAITRVQDNGGGVAEEVLPRVFEPYFTTREEGKGTGIGLYMSRRIIEDHMHGRIEVCNHGDGLRVTIITPAAEAMQAAV